MNTDLHQIVQSEDDYKRPEIELAFYAIIKESSVLDGIL